MTSNAASKQKPDSRLQRIENWSLVKINASPSEFRRFLSSGHFNPSVSVAIKAGNRMAIQLAAIGNRVSNLDKTQIEDWRRQNGVPKNRTNIMLAVAWSALPGERAFVRKEKSTVGNALANAPVKRLYVPSTVTVGEQFGLRASERRTVKKLLFCGMKTKSGKPCRMRTGTLYVGDTEVKAPRCRIHGTAEITFSMEPKEKAKPTAGLPKHQVEIWFRGMSKPYRYNARVAGVYSGYLRRQQKALSHHHRILCESSIPPPAKRLVSSKVANSPTICVDIDSMFHARCDRPAATGKVFCEECSPKGGK